MKYFKYIICIFALIILTGCEATYELNIDDGFTENIVVLPNNDAERSKMQGYKYNETAFYESDDFCEEGEKVPGVEYYSSTYSNALNFNYRFDKKYNESFAAKTNFPSFRYEAYEESLIITSDDIRVFYNYPELSKLTIKFVTNKEVLTHNADKVVGNTYIWEYQKGGETKSIYFKFVDPEYKGIKKDPNSHKNNNNNNNTNNKESKESKNKKSHTILLIFLCLFLSFLIIFGIIISGNKNKNN